MLKSQKRKTALFIILGIMITIALSGCGKPGSQSGSQSGSTSSASSSTSAASTSQAEATPGNSTVAANHPKIQFVMENGDKMTFELYPEYAPETVANFVTLAKSGFYNGLTFHRIVKGFMIQGGDPNGNGSGGSSKNIKGEFRNNGFPKNTLSHTKGIISMARGYDPNSASSQFFIMDGDQTGLDGDYAAFGKLTSGEATLDKIAATPVVTNPNMQGEVSLPTQKVVIKSVTVLDK
ncbi:MAG TPA: peptidylprolyl isomerase [Ruminiclostridium sp.]|nr:peptidylprolyl isomerase [Ruminiclostridium sp.]